MKSYTINGVPFEYDETLPYADFYVDAEGGHLIGIDFDKFILGLQSGQWPLEEFKEVLVLLDRWERDVPRKRFYRGMVKAGSHVLSGEYWFENVPDDEAEKIFTALENSGKVARRLLEVIEPNLAQKCKEDRYHPATKHYIEGRPGHKGV
jgi:hypothetical protein